MDDDDDNDVIDTVPVQRQHPVTIGATMTIGDAARAFGLPAERADRLAAVAVGALLLWRALGPRNSRDY